MNWSGVKFLRFFQWPELMAVAVAARFERNSVVETPAPKRFDQNPYRSTVVAKAGSL